MWAKRIICLILVVCLSIVLSTPVMAGTTQDVTVTATPSVTNGVVNFTITYISETQLDLSWGLDGDAVKIMIRAKYGEYPDDIPDEDTTPSDGYLVYYGSGTSVSDTTMDFDENSGPIYYKAWAQKVDDKWYVDTETGEEESAIMTLLAFFLFAGIMSFLALRTSFWIMKTLAGFSWIAVAVYWMNNPPSVVTQGDSTDLVVLVIIGGIAAAFILMPFWYTKNVNGQETGRFRFPFMQTDEEIEVERQRRYLPTRQERTSTYQDRIEAALRGETRRR